MTQRKKGKVGIVICIPRYVYKVEFESVSAFLGQVFQDNIRPISATALTASSEKSTIE